MHSTRNSDANNSNKNNEISAGSFFVRSQFQTHFALLPLFSASCLLYQMYLLHLDAAHVPGFYGLKEMWCNKA